MTNWEKMTETGMDVDELGYFLDQHFDKEMRCTVEKSDCCLYKIGDACTLRTKEWLEREVK